MDSPFALPLHYSAEAIAALPAPPGTAWSSPRHPDPKVQRQGSLLLPAQHGSRQATTALGNRMKRWAEYTKSLTWKHAINGRYRRHPPNLGRGFINSASFKKRITPLECILGRGEATRKGR